MKVRSCHSVLTQGPTNPCNGLQALVAAVQLRQPPICQRSLNIDRVRQLLHSNKPNLDPSNPPQHQAQDKVRQSRNVGMLCFPICTECASAPLPDATFRGQAANFRFWRRQHIQHESHHLSSVSSGTRALQDFNARHQPKEARKEWRPLAPSDPPIQIRIEPQPGCSLTEMSSKATHKLETISTSAHPMRARFATSLFSSSRSFWSSRC